MSLRCHVAPVTVECHIHPDISCLGVPKVTVILDADKWHCSIRDDFKFSELCMSKIMRMWLSEDYAI